MQNNAAEITAITADISPPTAITRLVESAANVYQRIDAVIDCVAAGPKEGGIAGEFSATDPQAYLSFMELSVVYFQQLTHAVLPWLKKTEGTLVALVSDAAIYPAAQQSLIGAARSATVGFIRNLAAEVARDAVRAHCVSPSFVLETNSADKLLALNPARLEKARQRAGLGLPTAVDIAPLVLFLCGSGARYITGQVISINGGLNT
mgnify:FL=1